jgi:hypothetical protein
MENPDNQVKIELDRNNLCKQADRLYRYHKYLESTGIFLPHYG